MVITKISWCSEANFVIFLGQVWLRIVCPSQDLRAMFSSINRSQLQPPPTSLLARNVFRTQARPMKMWSWCVPFFVIKQFVIYLQKIAAAYLFCGWIDGQRCLSCMIPVYEYRYFFHSPLFLSCCRWSVNCSFFSYKVTKNSSITIFELLVEIWP